MFLLKRGLLDTVVYTALMDSNKNFQKFILKVIGIQWTSVAIIILKKKTKGLFFVFWFSNDVFDGSQGQC